MSNPAPGQRPESETTQFHLSRFAHGASPESSSEGLTEIIRQAATEVTAESTKPVVVPRAAAPLAPDELLGAVAYCYVKGVFSSADIEQRMLRDSEFRAALDGVVPDPDAIRKFRRLNREAIHVVLEKFYARWRGRSTAVEAPGSVASTFGAGPRQGDENTATFVRRSATERLDQATFVDRMSDY